MRHQDTPLKRIRQAMRLTQLQAAKRIKVERGQLSRIENGRSVPTLRVLVGMARAYRVSLGELEVAVRGCIRLAETVTRGKRNGSHEGNGARKTAAAGGQR